MRIFAFSDQHGSLDFKLPGEADLILCAGDVCPDFFPRTAYGSTLQQKWLREKWSPFVADYTVLATFGNHDFVQKYDASKHFKVDELITVNDIKIWFSPWSNEFMKWSWMMHPQALREIYERIPEGIDILVSHQPPYGFGDQLPPFLRREDEDPEGHIGSKELLATIDRVKPKAVICGHIHSGYGIYEYKDTFIYNVALVDEAYKLVNEPTEIFL